MTPVRLQPAAFLSQVKHSTTELPFGFIINISYASLILGQVGQSITNIDQTEEQCNQDRPPDENVLLHIIFLYLKQSICYGYLNEHQNTCLK